MHIMFLLDCSICNLHWKQHGAFFAFTVQRSIFTIMPIIYKIFNILKFLINIKDCETLETVRVKISKKRNDLCLGRSPSKKRNASAFLFYCIPILSLCQPRLSVCNRYNMHERPICMGFTGRAVINHIQIGREHCILLKIRIHLNNYVKGILQPQNKCCLDERS